MAVDVGRVVKRTAVWLSLDQLKKLDEEATRRADEHRREAAQQGTPARNINRSTVLGDLVDKHL
jgi:hypothetical protein